MASIDASQDYDMIQTLTFASGSGTCNIRLYRGTYEGYEYSGTVYYRAGTSGSWTTLSVSGDSTTFPVSDTTMQVAHDWNKSGDDYMTCSFYGQSTNLTGIAMSQKAVLSGDIGKYFMYSYALGCEDLDSLDIPNISSATSVGSAFMKYYASNCTSLTSLGVPDTSGILSAGNDFMLSYADSCSSLTSLGVPDTSGLTLAGDAFMSYYASYCTSLTSLGVPDTSGILAISDDFMKYYASNCTSLTSLGVPDTSGFSWVGSAFMKYYASNCTSLTSLGVPDTSGFSSVGSNFMYHYAGSTSGLLELLLPNAGYFLSNNVDWKVPSGRLGYLKGRVLDVGDLSDWRGLTTSGDTLYTNYIRSSSDVFYTVDNSITKSAGYIVLRNSTLTKSAGYEVTSVDIKKSIYVKVYDSDGTTYIGTWAKDISSDNQISFRQEINQAGSETTISLARSADNFGEGEDIAHGNRVEIYVVDKEAPLGIVIFTGTITRYEVDYGVNKVTVIIRGYGEQLANRIMEDGSGKTKVSHLSKDPSDIFRDILDEYSGDITYDGSSIDDTSTAVSYTFNTNTVKEGIDKALELAPQNWYYYIDQATNLLHFHELASTPDHIFTIGKDITVLTVSKDMSKVVNTVYFAGGGGPPILYKKYTIPTSIANYGVRALSHKDSRVTLESTADIFAARLLQGSPEILITVAVIDSNLNDLGYDLESIKVGDTVQVMGAGVSVSSRYDSAEYDTSPYDYDLSNVSSILFQITSLDYTPNSVTVTLSTTPPDITKRIEDIYRNQRYMLNENNPDTPDV